MSGKVLLAAPRSFCAGVDRAIDIVEKLLEQHGPPIYVRHHIVHNDHVVRRLEELGAVFVDDEEEVPQGAICVLSAHGVAPAVRRNCERRGLRVVDAVCPLVSKVHAEARRYADSGHLVALVGHRDHVEVIGTKGERPDQIVVVESPEEAERARHERQAARGDQPDDALARRRRRDRRRARRALRRSPAARRRRHLLRDPEPAGRGQGDRLDGRDADPRDRLADELERAAAGRGRAGARRRGDADRRRERDRGRPARRARDRRPHRRRLDPGRARPGRARRGSPTAATTSSRRSRSRARTSTSGCRGRWRRDDIVEIPHSVAAALPTLSVFDITNEISRDVSSAGVARGIAYVTAAVPSSLVRVSERESGFFCDVEALLERLVAGPDRRARADRCSACSARARSRSRSRRGRLCLGQWQRVLLFCLDGDTRAEYSLTLLG